ncbi:DUF6624 domain-containing protein [Salinimicrobium xinjiangense]|uniref:DUF6624 domain-containing protein n=1 Tax=Salinimicrobium xinjiangense TaxID=438596 RepID=UPI00041F6185|nr:DUF6624 domain-containing protein [Salinimicrobium xinjiangense]
MKKILFLSLTGLLILGSCAQQHSGNYNVLIAEARALNAAGAYSESGEKYSAAFESAEDIDSISHRYEAATSWALAKQKDQAFEQLNLLTDEGKYSDLWQISSDDNFNSLRSDGRWMDVLTKVSENKKEAEAGLAEVAALLEVVYYDDQKLRQESAGIQEQYGRDSEEIRAHWELIGNQDSINLIKVKKVLDENGWLGTELIGRSANSALFLVIQHAGLETQEEYLPMLRQAVKRGAASPADLALLEDRVELRQGKKQIYGSQVAMDQETGEYYVSPLLDPENVNRRRAEVGLGPIEDYVSTWNIIWDAETYKTTQDSTSTKSDPQ